MKIKIFFFPSASFFFYLYFSIQPILAQSASDIAAELEARYHLNLKSIQNQGEYFNVSDQKKLFQRFSFFSPADPRPWSKINTKAFPIYFENKKKIFTIHGILKKNKCDLGVVGTRNTSFL